MNMIKKNDVIELKIDSCTLNGFGVGKYEGLTIFVPSVCPLEIIKAHILKTKTNYAYAKADEIIKSSDTRIEPLCQISKKCGGCVFSHIDYLEETKIKEEHVKNCFKRIGGLDIEMEPILSASKPYRYRNKAQFPVSQENGALKIGFFSTHSHRVINCEDCFLQPEDFSEIISVFKSYIKEFDVSIYDETTHTGLLRHIYLRKAVCTNQVMVCAVINGDFLPQEEELVEMLVSRFDNIKSIIVNSNKKKTNVITGDICRTIWGTDYIEDKLCDLTFRISPLSFYQVNHDQAEAIYRKAAEYADLTGNEVLIDLYCGTGTIGLTMASKVKKLIGIEIVSQAIENAKINADMNNISNATFICGDASVAIKKLREEQLQPDVVILDPPRKGCDDFLLDTLVEMNPEKIVYISCDPATLARDCRILDAKGYEVKKAKPFDLFPRAGHVETVVLMSKVK